MEWQEKVRKSKESMSPTEFNELLQCSTVFKVFAADCARQFLHEHKPETLSELEELDLKFPVNDSGDSASNRESINSFTLDEPCNLRKTVVLVAGGWVPPSRSSISATFLLAQGQVVLNLNNQIMQHSGNWSKVRYVLLLCDTDWALRDTFWHLQRLFQSIRTKAPNVQLIGMSQVPVVNSTHVSKIHQRAISTFNNAMNVYCESGIISVNRSRRSVRGRSNSNQTDGVGGLLRLFAVPADTLTAWQAHYEPEKKHYWTEEAAGEVVQSLIDQFESAIKDLQQAKTVESATATAPQTRSRRRRAKAAKS
ncbi:hypothetical protein M3Y94_01067400 [Aphelenchoides besseyi]|nr:hypothetical protein M3Y94_01067400 [Aphelenchoides besseyi]